MIIWTLATKLFDSLIGFLFVYGRYSPVDKPVSVGIVQFFGGFSSVQSKSFPVDNAGFSPSLSAGFSVGRYTSVDKSAAVGRYSPNHCCFQYSWQMRAGRYNPIFLVFGTSVWTLPTKPKHLWTVASGEIVMVGNVQNVLEKYTC